MVILYHGGGVVRRNLVFVALPYEAFEYRSIVGYIPELPHNTNAGRRKGAGDLNTV